MNEQIDQRLPHGILLRGAVDPISIHQGKRYREVLDKRRVNGLERIEKVAFPHQALRPLRLFVASLVPAHIDEMPTTPRPDCLVGPKHQQATDGDTLPTSCAIATVSTDRCEKMQIIQEVMRGGRLRRLIAPPIPSKRLGIEIGHRIGIQNDLVIPDGGRFSHHAINFETCRRIVALIPPHIGAAIRIVSCVNRAQSTRSRWHPDGYDGLSMSIELRDIRGTANGDADLCRVAHLIVQLSDHGVRISYPPNDAPPGFPILRNAQNEPSALRIGKRTDGFPNGIRQPASRGLHFPVKRFLSLQALNDFGQLIGNRCWGHRTAPFDNRRIRTRLSTICLESTKTPTPHPAAAPGTRQSSPRRPRAWFSPFSQTSSKRSVSVTRSAIARLIQRITVTVSSWTSPRSRWL